MKDTFIFARILLVWPVLMAARVDNQAMNTPDMAPPGILISQHVFSERTDLVFSTTDAEAFGLSAVDYNADGLLDVFCVTHASNDILFKNNGNADFSLINRPMDDLLGGRGGDSGISWGDYDNDGDIDPLMGNQLGSNLFFRNDNGIGFYQMTDGAMVQDKNSSFDAVWVDMNNDGWLDLYTGNVTSMGPGPGTANNLFQSNGDGTFTKILTGPIVEDAVNSATGSWADFDNDGDADLFVPDWGYDNKFYINHGGGVFASVTQGDIVKGGGTSISGAWADYDNDGDLDLFVANGYPSAEVDFLYRNNGDGTLTRITEGAIAVNRVTSWNGSWGDYDNDGDEDLYVSVLDSENLLYANNGDGTFSQVTDDPVVTHYGMAANAVWGDFDNDGDLDLITQDFNRMRLLYFENSGNANQWLKVQCGGTVSNQSAIGAKVIVSAVIQGRRVRQMREISASNGFRTMSNGLHAHFGLGDAAAADSLIVLWPSGQKSVTTNIAAGQFVRIIEDMPSGFLKSVFNADHVSGCSALEVQFTDCSLCDPETPVTSWEWDFNGDGIIDSQEQNPRYAYLSQEAAQFSVQLTVSNGVVTRVFKRPGLIKMAGYTSIIRPGGQNMELGTIAHSSDTSFQICNYGDKADSISIITALSKYSDVVSISPAQFTLAAYDSQTISLHIDTGSLSADKNYTIRLTVKTENKTTYSKYLRFTTGSTSAAGRPAGIPEIFALKQNYPNPFNPVTQINYSLPEAGQVLLQIFNSIGCEVQTLVHEVQTAGEYTVPFDGSRFTSGVYVCSLKAGGYSAKHKMLLIK